MRASLFIPFIFFIFSQVLNGQAYQIIGKDNTGNNIESALPGLIEMAERLVDSLPEDFQESFKVFSVSFYLHNQDFTGGIPPIFLRMIDSVDNLSPYSLLIGRQVSETYRNYKFWVRLKLPDSDLFQCFTEDDFVFIQTKLHNVLNKSLPNNSVNGFVQPEKDVMKELISIISKAKICCQRNPIQCLDCPDDINAVRDMMELFGFKSLPITSLTKTAKFDTVGNVDEYIEMNVNFNGSQINVNSDIETFLNKMGAKVGGVSGEIFFYDPANVDCDIIMNKITEGQSEEYFSIIGLNSSNRSILSEEEFTFKVTLIGSIDESGDPALHIRIDELQREYPNGKYIYLLCLEDCGLNMQTVNDSLEGFFKLMGPYIKPGNGYQIPDEEIPLDPVIIDISYLPVEFVQEHTIVLFGLPSYLIQAVQHPGEYSPISGNWSNPEDQEVYAIASHGVDNLEKARHKGNIAIVRSDLSNQLQQWKCTTKEQLASFLAFHAVGHNAGIYHEWVGTNGVLRPKHSFMSDARVIVQCFFGYFANCKSCAQGDEPYLSPQEMVIKTMSKDYINAGVFNKSIKQLIYERFIQTP